MKVAFVVNNYPPRVGGVELHVQSLARELVRAGHDALVVTLGDRPGWRSADGVSVLTLPEHFRVADILGFPGFGTKRRLACLLREQGVDVVSVHTRFFPMSFIGWRAARKAHLPLLHTEHGSDHVSSSSAVISVASRAVDFTLGRAVLRGADRVLGVSEEVTGFVRRLAGVRAEVFFNAIEPVEMPGHQAPQRGTHLVFVGRLVPGKGWEDYLQVLSRLRIDRIEVTGEILGDGSDMPKLRAEIDRLGLQDSVAVRGRVSQLEVRDALRGATLLNPTRLSEGFQTTLLESVAEGGSVVTYPVPGAAALAAEGAPVMITEDRCADSLHQAVVELLAAPLPAASPGLIEPWTWPARSRQFTSICEQEIARKR